MSEVGLLEQYQPMVLSLAKKHRGCGLDFDDLVQEGTIGLIKAIRGYDPAKGRALGPYAKAWIRGEILQAINRNKKLITGLALDIPVSSNIIEDIYSLDATEQVYENIKSLNEKQAAVITDRWLQDSPAKLRELSAKLEISIERVRQIEEISLSKLRDSMTNLGYT